MFQPYTYHETLLKVDNVSKSYGPKNVLRDINFEVKDIVCPGRIQGQIVGLIGQSGSGKTTILNLLAGLDQPTSGNIQLYGTNNHSVQRGRMGLVYQNYYLYQWEKVKNILWMAASKNLLLHHPSQNIDKRKETIESISQDFNLMDHLNKYPSELSGGQKQRVALAEQILCGNDFILLDEPFSGLDVLMIDKVTNFLIKVSITDELKTLIIVSHDLSNTCAISDTVYVLGKEKEKEGSTILHTVNMMDRGLAWTPNIKDDPMFRETLKEIKSYL